MRDLVAAGRRPSVERPATRFIGRATELAALDDAVADDRLVTVLGPPGVGKTRLAKEYGAAREADRGSRFPGGVWFCDVSEARDAEGIVARWEAALPGPVESLGRALVIVDNFDALCVHAADTVGTWLARAPALQLVVTSRERLRIEGERLFDLRPLSLPAAGSTASESVELFLDRARAVSSTAFEPAQQAAVVELVRLLDGMPLAIELAAARARVLAPTQILETLQRGAAVLSPSREVLAKGARTIFDVLVTSWDTLDEAERSLLSRCSVFAGGFDLRAAEAIVPAADPPLRMTVLDGLHGLRDRSLLSAAAVDGADGGRRLEMLATVRLFAAERLEPAARAALERAHARHYLDRWARDLHRATTSEGREIARERENLVAVHERALCDGRPRDAVQAAILLAPLASSLSYGWARKLVDSALDAASLEDSDPLLGWALEARGTLLRFMGRAASSLVDLEKASKIAEALGDRRLRARALLGLGNGAAVLARWSEARASFELALSIHAALADRLAEGRNRTMLAGSFYNEERFDEAESHLERALVLQREEEDRVFEGMSVTSIGIVALARGAHTRAQVAFDEALRVHGETKDRHWEAVTMGYLGSLALDRGDLRDARARLTAARSTLADLGVRRAEAIVLVHLGHVATLEGLLDEAASHYQAALGWHRLSGPDYEGLTIGCIGALAALRGDEISAQAAFERANASIAACPRPSFVAALACLRVLLDVARGRVALAQNDARSAAALEASARVELERATASAAPTSVDARFATRLVGGAVQLYATMRKDAEASRDPSALVVHPEGIWFRAPGRDEMVRLHKRPNLARILRALVERHSARPGDALDVAALLASGWPGEKVLPDAGQDRVYTAVSTLRRMGLRDVVMRREDGYCIDAAIRVVASVAEPATAT